MFWLWYQHRPVGIHMDFPHRYNYSWQGQTPFACSANPTNDYVKNGTSTSWRWPLHYHYYPSVHGLWYWPQVLTYWGTAVSSSTEAFRSVEPLRKMTEVLWQVLSRTSAFVYGLFWMIWKIKGFLPVGSGHLLQFQHPEATSDPDQNVSIALFRPTCCLKCLNIFHPSSDKLPISCHVSDVTEKKGLVQCRKTFICRRGTGGWPQDMRRSSHTLIRQIPSEPILVKKQLYKRGYIGTAPRSL